jgi:site-specific DNA recombinase
MSMEHQEKAVAIARVSSKRQEEEGYSLPAQKKLLKSYSLERGLILLETFEIAESASKTEQRKIFKEAMKFIEDKQVKNLVVEKVDRHVRNLNDAVETHDWLMADENKKVHFVKDSLVMHKNSRSQEWLNWGIRVVMAKNYIDNLREEAMKGWAEKLAQGWLPHSPPVGYKTVLDVGKRIHVPDSETEKLMVKAFKNYTKPGESLASTAMYMHEIGVTSKSGRTYSKSQVHRILSNPFYIGINHFDNKDYPGAQIPIISRRLFDEVQRKLHQGRPRAYSKHTSPLQNMIRCEDCGSVVTWQLQKGRYYGVCRRLTPPCKLGSMLREDKIEASIMELLTKLICPSSEVIDWLIGEVREKHHDDIAERELLKMSLEAQIKRLDTMDDNLYEDKLSGELSIGKYEVKHERFMKQKQEFIGQLSNLDSSLNQRLEQRIVLLELSQKAAQIYANRPPEQKRLIISKLFSSMTLKQGAVSVKYTDFAEMIANNVLKTRNLMEA